MSDVARYLPLSQTPRGDESGVSSDWSRQLGVVLTDLATVVGTLRPDELDAASLIADTRVRDTLAHLCWRLGTSRTARARAVMRQMATARQGSTAAVRALAARTPHQPDTAARLRELAAAVILPGSRASIADLSVAVVDGLDVAVSTGRVLAIDGVTTGAVALARSLSAPTPIRAVVRERTLVASDADWSVGIGRALPGTAAQIVLFLWGRADVPRDATRGA
jgi:hypothetical protein